MKILYVNSLYPPDIAGGAELSLAMLAGGQHANGHDVLVAATTGATEVIEECVAGVPVIRLPLDNLYWPPAPDPKPDALRRLVFHARDIDNRGMAEALASVVRRFDPDVISFHNLIGFSASAWRVASELGKPSVQVLHDYYNLCPKSQLFRADRNCETPCKQCSVFRVGRARASNQVSAVVGASQAVLDAHLRNGLFAEVAARRVINNARHYPAAPRREYPALAKTFGFIGTVAPWKGITLVLDAFERLRREPGMEGLRFVVAGGGEADYLAELRARYASPAIEFVGKVKPADFFATIDASIVPSLWHDPLPGVVFESMIFGVPVIGARRGGIPEMIAHEVDGLLFEPLAEAELDACMRLLASVPQLLGEYGDRAQRASAHYSDTSRVINAYHQLYEEVIAA